MDNNKKSRREMCRQAHMPICEPMNDKCALYMNQIIFVIEAMLMCNNNAS
jgi:hypothetical protein